VTFAINQREVRIVLQNGFHHGRPLELHGQVQRSLAQFVLEIHTQTVTHQVFRQSVSGFRRMFGQHMQGIRTHRIDLVGIHSVRQQHVYRDAIAAAYGR
jgi:hypothetical protein